MEIHSVFQIARREWENIALSLELCGDIGKLDFAVYVESNSELIFNLLDMDDKIHEQGYLTKESAYVFTDLGSKAGQRLGLNEEMSRNFGAGYSWVRTGWIDLIWLEPKHLNRLREHLTRQIVFYKLFFPQYEDFDWLFDSSAAVCNFKSIFDKFRLWQNDPKGYNRYVNCYKTQIEPLWEDLNAALDVASGRC